MGESYVLGSGERLRRLGTDVIGDHPRATTCGRTAVRPRRTGTARGIAATPLSSTADQDRRLPGGDPLRKGPGSPIVLETGAEHKGCITDG